MEEKVPGASLSPAGGWTGAEQLQAELLRNQPGLGHFSQQPPGAEAVGQNQMAVGKPNKNG